MGSCSNSSMWGNNDGKYIKIYDGNIVGVNKNKFDFTFLLNDLRIPYTDAMLYRIVLDPNESDVLLFTRNYAITFILVRVFFDNNMVDNEDRYILYKIKNGCEDENVITSVLMQTGSSDNPLSNISFTNPSENYPVSIEVLVCYDMSTPIQNFTCL